MIFFRFNFGANENAKKRKLIQFNNHVVPE